MIVDPGDVIKMEGAFQKLDDAVNKLCDVRISTHTTAPDVLKVQKGIDELGATKMALSTLIPPVVP